MYPNGRWRSPLTWSMWKINTRPLILILLKRNALETFKSSLPIKLSHLNSNLWLKWENVFYFPIISMFQDPWVFSFKIGVWNFSLAFLFYSILDFLLIVCHCFHLKWCKVLNVAWVKFFLKLLFRNIGKNLKTSKKWKIQGSWNGTIVLSNRRLQRLYASNPTITKLWPATTNKTLRFYVHSKTMKGANERLLKTTPIYTIS
jgi:hypothetical protein